MTPIARLLTFWRRDPRSRRVAAMVREFVAAGGLTPDPIRACPDCGSPRRDMESRKGLASTPHTETTDAE